MDSSNRIAPTWSRSILDGITAGLGLGMIAASAVLLVGCSTGDDNGSHAPNTVSAATTTAATAPATTKAPDLDDLPIGTEFSYACDGGTFHGRAVKTAEGQWTLHEEDDAPLVYESTNIDGALRSFGCVVDQ